MAILIRFVPLLVLVCRKVGTVTCDEEEEFSTSISYTLVYIISGRWLVWGHYCLITAIWCLLVSQTVAISIGFSSQHLLLSKICSSN